jgi:hypothetical protein
VATQDDLRSTAAELPETEPGSHHGREDIRVRDKIFATLPPDGSIVLKTTPENLDALVSAEPQTFRRIWGERWVGVDVERLAVERLRDLVCDAWRLAAPKALVRAYDEATRG